MTCPLTPSLSPVEVGCFRLRPIYVPNSGKPEFGGEREPAVLVAVHEFTPRASHRHTCPGTPRNLPASPPCVHTARGAPHLPDNNRAIPAAMSLARQERRFRHRS